VGEVQYTALYSWYMSAPEVSSPGVQAFSHLIASIRTSGSRRKALCTSEDAGRGSTELRGVDRRAIWFFIRPG